MNNLILSDLIIGHSFDMPLGMRINYHFMPKNLYYLQGSNGSGKTTLMRTLCGYLPPLSGDISEKNLFETTAYYGHESALKQKMTVFNYIDFCYQMFDNTQSPTDLIDIFNLKPLMEMQISCLSCGQKKRVSLVGFLLCNRDMYCFDEASSGLDSFYKDVFYDYLKMLAFEKHKIILFSDHIPPQVIGAVSVNMVDFKV